MKSNLVVIGLGYVGLPLVVAALNSGFNVYGFDISAARINELKSGRIKIEGLENELLPLGQGIGQINFTNRIDDVPGNSIFVIAVPTPLNDLGEPDLNYLDLACESIAKVISSGALVISESTSYIGTLRNFIKNKIDKLSGVNDIEYGIAPERIDPGNQHWSLRNTPRIISGLTEAAAQNTQNFYKNFCENVITVSSPEIAEASKLLENTFRLVNIALINEFSDLAHKLGLNTFEIISAAATKPFGFMHFLPGIGVGGHCIPIDPVYLLHSAKDVNLDLQMVKLATEMNSSAHISVIEKLKNLLKTDLENTKIQIVGIAYKVDIADTRESPAIKLVNELRLQGATVTWHDPLVKEYKGEFSMPLSLDIDLGLLVSPHSCVDLSFWRNNNVKVFDLSASKVNYGWAKVL